MEEVLSNYSVSDILMFGFFIGMVFNIIQDIIMSLIDYLREKAWRVIDYEEIIYENIGTYSYDYDETNKKQLVAEAINNHYKRLQKRKNLDKFLSKFRRKKNDV